MADVLAPTGRIEIETRNAFYLVNFDTGTLKRVGKDSSVLGLRGLYRQKRRADLWMLSRPKVFLGAHNIEIGHGAYFELCDGDRLHTSKILKIRVVPTP